MHRLVKRKMSFGLTVSLCSVIGIAVQLICMAATAYMVGKGSIPESWIQTTSYLIQGVGLLLTTVAAWNMSADNKLSAAGLSAGVLIVIPVLCSLLLWEMDWTVFAINFVISVCVFVACVWLLNTTKKGRGLLKTKKRYC